MSLKKMQVALMMVNLVVRTPEYCFLWFFQIFTLFGLIFTIFYMYNYYFSV
jgi:hypothetical protein